MRRFDPHCVPEKISFSRALNESLNEITNKCKGFTAMEFSRQQDLKPSELSRMKLFFKKMDAPYVSPNFAAKIREVLLSLYRQFPGLTIWILKNGEYKAVLRLDKMRGKNKSPLAYQNGQIVASVRGRPRKVL